MSETFEGRLRVSAWQDGSRAWIATSAGEIPVLGEAVFERLFRYVFPPFGGEQTFENARIQGERGPKGIHKVVLLVIKTTFIEAHVRGEDRAALLSERTKDDHVGDTFEGHFRRLGKWQSIHHHLRR